MTPWCTQSITIVRHSVVVSKCPQNLPLFNEPRQTTGSQGGPTNRTISGSVIRAVGEAAIVFNVLRSLLLKKGPPAG